MRFLLIAVLLITSLPSTPAAKLAGPTLKSTPQDPPAPTATPTPDAALEQAKRDALLADELKKKAVSDRERTEAEAARLKALVQPFGGATVTVPTGSIQTDKAGWVESQMLAQEAARQITASLTHDLCVDPKNTGGGKLKINQLVIHNANDFTAVELYSTARGQLEHLHAELGTKNCEAEDMLLRTDPAVAVAPPAICMNSAVDAAAGPLVAAAAPSIATGFIKSVAELVNLFRTDTSFENDTVNVSEDTIVSHVARNLMNSGFKLGATELFECNQWPTIYYPLYYPPLLTRVADQSNSNLARVLGEIEEERIQGESFVVVIDARLKELNQLKGKLADKKAKSDQLKSLEDKLKELQQNPKPNATQIKALEKQIRELKQAIVDLGLSPAQEGHHDDLPIWIALLTDLKIKMQGLFSATNLITAKLNTPDESGKLTALAHLFRAEKLHEILARTDTYVLRVTASANGTTKIKKNLFVDAKVRHSAGTTLVYQLFENDGSIAQGGALRCYIDYQSSKNVRRMASREITLQCSTASQ